MSEFDNASIERLKLEEKEADNETIIGDSESEDEESTDLTEDEVSEEIESEEGDSEDSEDEYEIEKDSIYDGKKCVYDKDDGSQESSEEVNEINKVVDIDFDDEEYQVKTSNRVPANERITKPILTKYERVRLLSDRTQQLTLGAKPMVKNIEGLTPKEIAIQELKVHMMPLIIKRPRPDGKSEIWYTKELKQY